MKTQSMLLAALASAPVAFAHTAFTNFYVDGQDQGDAVAMRMSKNPEHSTAPIGSLGSDDMACNVGGTKGVSRVQPVADGATLTFEIRAWPADPSRERLEPGHKGPCAVYLKKVTSAVEDTGAGDGWFKIFEHGYDADSKQWCSDKVIANDGLLNVKLPVGLEGGDYLARPELLALHAANDRDPQFYTGCAQIFLKSDGNLVPESTVSIPGYVDYDQPATSFDIYNKDASTYQLPGPKLAKLSPNGVQSASTGQKTQTDGLKPAGCLVENGNWCGKEVSDYTTEKGCWASGEECWQQAEKCFDAAPITGSKGCKLWQTKCQGINDACTAGDFTGPPNKNTVLKQEKKSIDVGPILSGGIDSKNIDTTPQSTKKAETPAAKPTSAAPVKEEPKTSSKASAAPAKPTATDYSSPDIVDHEAAPSYKPAPSEHKPEAAAPTSTKEASEYEASPAPTPAPKPAHPQGGSSCIKGHPCVTVTEIETVYETVTVTAAPPVATLLTSLSLESLAVTATAMQARGTLGVPCHLPAVVPLSRRQFRVSAVALGAAAPPSVVPRSVTHSMPPEKEEVFRSLQGWAAGSLLPLLKPVDDCWQPTDFLPDSSSEMFEHEVRELRARAASLPDEYFVVLVGDMVTEEALPTYQTMINTLDGVRDETGASACPWAVWTRAWTAEENRHGDVLNKYAYLSGRVDMRAVERTVQYLIGSGMDPGTENNPYLGFVYTSFQERATAVSHGNTARLARARGDDVLARVCGTIAADEKRHETAYSRIVEQLLRLDPDGAVLAIADMMRKRITMPAHLMHDGSDMNLFEHFASVAQRLGVYTARDYTDIVEFLVKRWKLETLEGGLSGEGRRARDFVCGLAPRMRRAAERAADRAKKDDEPRKVKFSWIYDREVVL